MSCPKCESTVGESSIDFPFKNKSGSVNAQAVKCTECKQIWVQINFFGHIWRAISEEEFEVRYNKTLVI